jgi:hypothetical protein
MVVSAISDGRPRPCGSSFGAEKSLQDILHNLCVDIVIGVKDIVTYDLFNLLEMHLRASVENVGSKVAMTISETEDLENGGELQEAFPPVNEVEQTVKTLYDAISTDLSVSQRDDHELLIKEYIHCFSNELDRKIDCKNRNRTKLGDCVQTTDIAIS